MADFQTDLLEAIAETFREFLIINGKAFGLEDSDIIKNIKIKVEKSGLSITYPYYLKFIESGRRAGTHKGVRVPILVLVKWLKKKRIAPGDENRVAWAIQQSIYKRGMKNAVKPRPFFTRTVEDTEEEVATLLAVSFKDLIENKIIATLNNGKR